MRWQTLLAVLVITVGPIPFATAEEKDTTSNLLALCYHDVRDDVRGRGGSWGFGCNGRQHSTPG